MREEDEFYIRESFDDSGQCTRVTVKRVPNAWRPILRGRTGGKSMWWALLVTLLLAVCVRLLMQLLLA